MQSIFDTALARRRRTRRWRAPTSSRRCPSRARPSRRGPRAPARRIRRHVRDPEGAPRRRPGAVPRAAGHLAAAAARPGELRRRSDALPADGGGGQSRPRCAKGLAIARAGPAIFGVAPISDAQGKHVGSFEFGLDFGAMLVALEERLWPGLHAVHRGKAAARIRAGVDPAVLSDQNRVGRFIRFHTTNGALMKDLARDADISVVNEPMRYTRDAAGRALRRPARPAARRRRQSLGVVAAARDFSGSRAAAGRSLVWQICLAIFAIVILSGRHHRGDPRLPAAAAGRPRSAASPRSLPASASAPIEGRRQIRGRDPAAGRPLRAHRTPARARGARVHDARGNRAGSAGRLALLGTAAAGADQPADWTRACRSWSRWRSPSSRSRRSTRTPARSRPPSTCGCAGRICGCAGRRRKPATRPRSIAAPMRKRSRPRSGRPTVELANQRGEASRTRRSACASFPTAASN